jgi:hypothetical protein
MVGAAAASRPKTSVSRFSSQNSRPESSSARRTSRSWRTTLRSGPTEAGCKVMQGRLKGAGMRWGVGSERVGALKALYACGEGLWGAFWTQPQRSAA